MNTLGNITTVIAAEDMQALDPSAFMLESLPKSIYAARMASAARNPDKITIQYMLDGDCFDPDNISLKKCLLGGAVNLIKGKG